MNAHQRRIARRLKERAFGTHVDYMMTVYVEGARDGYFDDDFDDDGNEPDDFEDEFETALSLCSMHADGQCGAAGSEYCDWECPVMKWGGFGEVADEASEG